MPEPIIANVLRSVWNWSHPNAGTAVNVVHWRRQAGETEADLAAALTSNVASGMFESVNGDADCTSFDIKFLDGASAAQSFPNTWSGGAGTTGVIPASSCIVKLITAFSGRSHRGRIYLPMVDESIQLNGQFTFTIATMQTGWETFVTSMAADGFDLVVASYLLETADDVTSLLVESSAATQRRRQTRVRV